MEDYLSRRLLDELEKSDIRQTECGRYIRAAGLDCLPHRLLSPRLPFAAAWVGKYATLQYEERAVVYVAADHRLNSSDDSMENTHSEWSAGIMTYDQHKAFCDAENQNEKSEIILDTLEPNLFPHAFLPIMLLDKILPQNDFPQEHAFLPIAPQKLQPYTIRRLLLNLFRNS